MSFPITSSLFYTVSIFIVSLYVEGIAAQLVAIPKTPQNAKVRSLDPTRALSSYKIDTWTVKNGLPVAGADGICQTDDGFLWLRSWNSITRFDGRRFQTFRDIPALKHPNSSVGGIVAGRGNRLWCVCFSLDTVFLCKLQSGQWQTFSLGTIKDQFRFTVLPDKHSAEVLWMIMDEKLVRFENGKTMPILSNVQGWSSSTFSAIAQDSGGNLYAAGNLKTTKGTVENILYCLHNARVVKTYTQAMGLISDPYYQIDFWREFLLETHGTDVWIVNTAYVKGKIISTIQRLRNGRVETLAEVPEDELIVGISMSPEGVLYLQPYGSGIYRYFDGQLDNLNREEVEKGKISHAINTCLVVDKEGALWTCTGSRLSRIRNDRFAHVDKTNGLPENTLSYSPVMKGQDSLLFASNSGIIVMHKGRISTVRRKDGLLTDTVRVLAKDSSGQVWIGLSGGLHVLQNGKLRSFTKKDGLVNDTIRDIMTDTFGRVWIGSQRGIQVYQPSTKRLHTLFKTSKNALDLLFLSCVDKSQ
ncbi:MAG: hypothetical protein MUF71_21315 [Candidatus Kapabacteria bacterium]|jgi:ligand-binding sensor domain-containing protein|nr:hypothetical protein [Candidatus Kapabacteria bacterium]